MAGNNTKFLNGWKQIASYLDRGIRTVQRWEAQFGLPVRRPHGKRKSAVVALAQEIDEWLEQSPLAGSSRSAADIPSDSRRVFVIEDSVTDLNTCVSVLRRLGVKEVDVASNVPAALLRLEDIAAGKLPPPDLMILDLAFPVESGFEVLRACKMHDALKQIQLVVWTAVSEAQHPVCQFLGAREVVPKSSGPKALELALLTRNAPPVSRRV